MDVELAICILCTDFSNTVIWESWRTDDERGNVESRIGLITHPRPEKRHHVAYSVADPIETAWGSDSLMWAEIKLFDDALKRFFRTRHLLIVSGDTVPIRTKEDFLAFYLSDETSSVTLRNDVFPIDGATNVMLTRAGIRRMYNGHQFISLTRAHAAYLVSQDGLDRLSMIATAEYHTPGFTGTFNPDEVIIQTLLTNTFPMKQFHTYRFVDYISERTHAKVLTLEEFKELYEQSMQTDTIHFVLGTQEARGEEFGQLEGGGAYRELMINDPGDPRYDLGVAHDVVHQVIHQGLSSMLDWFLDFLLLVTGTYHYMSYNRHYTLHIINQMIHRQ